MKLTSTNFRKNNNILFNTRIKKGSLETARPGITGLTGRNNADVIDINQNGIADIESRNGIFTGDYIFKEPVLDFGYSTSMALSSVKDYARSKETEVLTQDSSKDIDVKEYGVHAGLLNGHKIENNVRSIRSLVDQITPDNKNAKWAIDVEREEFIIYEPGK